MGDARRRIEIIASASCPCGSGKSGKECCFDGKKWHKSAANLGLRKALRTERVEKCYMKELESCIPPISSEHIISNSVCNVLSENGKHSISGLPWLDPGEERFIAPITANCLCKKHNSDLSPLDVAAGRFFATLKDYMKSDKGSKHFIISGHDIERWLLKTAKAAAVSKNLAIGKGRLLSVFSKDENIVDMLDNYMHWPEGSGLYCTMQPRERIDNTPHFKLTPGANASGEIEVLAASMLGFEFHLLLEKPDDIKYPYLHDAVYRPGGFRFKYPNATHYIEISWEDNKKHRVANIIAKKD